MVDFMLEEELKFAAVNCPYCGEETFIELTDKEVEDLKKVKERKMLVHEALAGRTRTIREAFTSGICVECWNRMFPHYESEGSFIGLEEIDGMDEYLVTFTSGEEDGETVVTKVSAINTFMAINEAVESVVGYKKLPVARITEYNDAIEAVCEIGEVYKLPCEFVVEKTRVSVAKLVREEGLS